LLLSKQHKIKQLPSKQFCLLPIANQQKFAAIKATQNKATAIKTVLFAANSKPTKYLLLPKQH
jgi:hypothetical protein